MSRTRNNAGEWSLQRQPFFYVIIVLIIALALVVLRPFFAAIVLAFLTALFFKPVYQYFHHIFGKREKLASLVSVTVVIIAVMIPLLFIAGLTVNQILEFTNDIDQQSLNLSFFAEKGNNLANIIPGVDYTLTEQDVQDWIERGAKALGQFFLARLPNIGTGAFNFFTQAFIFVVVLYALFPVQKKLYRFIEDVSPLDDRVDRLYIMRVVEMARSMVKGVFLIAVVQAIVSGIFLWIAGVDYVLFFSILMVFFGVIPMLGVGIVVIPIALVVLFTGGIWQGIFLIATNILVVANIDNYLRPKLVSKKASLHPALVIISVLGGLQVFGMLGFVYGPVIMILLVTTLEMYLKHVRGELHTAKQIKKGDD